MKPVELVQRNKFLIGVGVLVLVGVVAVVAFFLPVRKTNAQEQASLETKASSLDSYAGKKLVVAGDVDEAKKLAQQYQKTLEELRASLAETAKPVKEPLLKGSDSGPEWKLAYSKDVDDLLKELQQDFLVVGDNPIVAQSYGDDIPTPEQMSTQTAYFHVQQYAIDAIAKLNKGPDKLTVPVFDGFSFLPAPERLLSPTQGQEFTPIPFEIKLKTNFETVPRILHSLLESPVQFEITSISVARPKRIERGEPQVAVRSLRSRQATPPSKKTTGPTVTAATVAPTTPSASASAAGRGAGYTGPSQEQIQRMMAEQEALAKQQAATIMQQMQQMGPGSPYGPPTTTFGPPTTARTAPKRSTTGMRTAKGTELNEAIKAKLPKTLVDVTIRGYVADYAIKKG